MSAEIAIPYHLVLRHKGDGYQLCEWHEADGHAMSYQDARSLLDGLQRKLPGLHKAGQGFYLIAKPIRAVSS